MFNIVNFTQAPPTTFHNLDHLDFEAFELKLESYFHDLNRIQGNLVSLKEKFVNDTTFNFVEVNLSYLQNSYDFPMRMERFENRKDQLIYRCENIFKAAWEKIKAFWQWLVKKIKSFFGISNDKDAQIQEKKKEVSDLNKQINNKPPHRVEIATALVLSGVKTSTSEKIMDEAEGKISLDKAVSAAMKKLMDEFKAEDEAQEKLEELKRAKGGSKYDPIDLGQIVTHLDPTAIKFLIKGWTGIYQVFELMGSFRIEAINDNFEYRFNKTEEILDRYSNMAFLSEGDNFPINLGAGKTLIYYNQYGEKPYSFKIENYKMVVEKGINFEDCDDISKDLAKLSTSIILLEELYNKYIKGLENRLNDYFLNGQTAATNIKNLKLVMDSVAMFLKIVSHGRTVQEKIKNCQDKLAKQLNQINTLAA